MKRVLCTRVCEQVLGAEVVLQELPEPIPGPGEVRVDVFAAPINPADLLLLTGRHIARPEVPFPIGIEGAGRISACGAGVDGLVPGTPVALPFGGTWSEQVILHARDVVALPSSLDLEQAAMLSVNPVTAAGLLHGLEPGTWLIQNAAASAVGTLVIRLARLRGIRTLNVVRRASQVPALSALGADAVLVGDHDLDARCLEATGGIRPLRGLDAVAGEAAGRLHAVLADGAALICYGLLASDDIVLPAKEVIFRDVTIRGYSRLRWLKSISVAARDALYAELSGLLQEGRIDSQVEARYPLSEVQAAIRHAAQEGRSGKILLQCAAERSS